MREQTNQRDKTEECSVVITLTQKLERRKCEHSIGFRLYERTDQPEGILPARFVNDARNVTAKSGPYVNVREISKTFSLSEGSYCLVPSTFSPGEEGEYLIRIYVDNRWRCDTEGERFTIRDHTCCFTCCYSCKHVFSSCCNCKKSRKLHQRSVVHQIVAGQILASQIVASQIVAGQIVAKMMITTKKVLRINLMTVK